MLPADLIYIILHYLTPADRYNLRQTSYYLFVNGWLDDEREYAYCSNRKYLKYQTRCLAQDHLNCVKFFPSMSIEEKLCASISLGSEEIYQYYRNKAKVNNELLRSIIDSSNERAVLLVANNPDIIGRLSFHTESIIRNSTISFIKLIIQVIYGNNYQLFYNEFKWEISESCRPDLNLLFD